MGNFDRRMDGALSNGVVDDEELSVLRDRLAKVRQALERSTEYTVSKQYIAYLVDDIQRATLNDLQDSDSEASEQDVFDMTDDARDRAAIQSSFPDQLAAVAWTVQPLIATLGEYTRDLDETFARWGMLTTPRRLAVLKSEDHVFREFGEQDAGSRAVALINQARSAYTLTFSQTTANTSLGPIANDVLQSVLTENGFIDEIVSKDAKRRWKPFTASSSKARTGNSNTVIYLENLATPVLKTAQFDPSAFVARMA
ncbi:MAG: hypothetical protein HC888_13455 [Candidatus Competibacteraceae bacterium]|nr:hypothetical protein [Candidatus Competibacteraceae bacterium]